MLEWGFLSSTPKVTQVDFGTHFVFFNASKLFVRLEIQAPGPQLLIHPREVEMKTRWDNLAKNPDFDETTEHSMVVEHKKIEISKNH